MEARRKRGKGVLVLAALGDALIVDDLREWEAGGDEGEGVFGFGVFAGVEAGEAEVEAGFEREAIRGRDLGEGGGGFIVLAGGVVLLAEGEESGGVAWGFGDGELEALDALGWGGGVGSADVIFKGAEADSGGGGEEGLLGDVEAGFDLACDFPGDGVFDVEEAGEWGGILKRGGEAELADGEDLGLDEDALIQTLAGSIPLGGISLEVEAADDDVVCVEILGDADGGGAGGAELRGEAEVVEGELAVVAGDGEEAGGGEALVEGVGEGVADPVEVRVAGAVVEGEDEDDAAAGILVRAGILGGLGQGWGEDRGDRGQEGGEGDQQAGYRGLLHRGDYSARRRVRTCLGACRDSPSSSPGRCCAGA